MEDFCLQDAESFSFYFKDRLALTEDHIVIYNIFFFNVPALTTIENMREHFENYGAINNIRFLNKAVLRRCSKYGYVNFKNPFEAARALICHNHKVFDERFYVRPCDSWHQPKPIVRLPIGTTSIKNINTCQRQSIVCLNVDCLFIIFKNLNVQAQVRLATNSIKLTEVMRMYTSAYYKILDTDLLTILTLSEIRVFLKMCGDLIIETKGRLPFKYPMRVLDFIINYCGNLQIMRLKSYKITPNIIKKLSLKLHSLKVLEVSECFLKDRSIKELCKLSQLETLTLCHNNKLTGKYMDELSKSIRNLTLLGCSSLQSTLMADFLDNLTNLRELDIRGCEASIWYMFSEIVKRMKNLETLRCSCPVFVPYEDIAELSNLKCLEIDSHWQAMVVRHELFSSLSKHKADTLQTLIVVAKNSVDINCIRDIALLQNLRQLDIGENAGIDDECLKELVKLSNLEELCINKCLNITNIGLLNYLRCNVNLRKLDVQNNSQITDIFIEDALKLLTNRKMCKSLTVYAASSGIGEKWDGDDTVKSLIKVTHNEVFLLRSELIKKRQFEFMDDVWIGEDGNYQDIWDFLKSDHQYDNYHDIFDYDDDDEGSLEGEFALNLRFEQFARRM